MKKNFLFIFMVYILSSTAYGATGLLESSYSYDYTQPPEFQPSLKNQFTSLSDSVTDVLVNPAGIMQVNTFEVALGVSGYVQNPIREERNTLSVEDVNFKGINDSPNSRAYGRLTDDRNAITAEARPFIIDESYSKGGGINYFGTTYRVSDWLAFSVSRKRPTAMAMSWQMLAPVMADLSANFRSTSVEAGGPGNSLLIRQDGTIEVIVGGVAMATSEVAAWSGFLDQGTSEVNWINAEFDNSMANHNSVILTTAIKTGPISWGLNIIPESVDIEMNNEISITSDPNNGRIAYYIPDLNFSSTEAAIYWATVECGTAGGYRSIEVETLPGQQLAGAKVAGKYTASFVQMDLGAQWEPTDYLSFGAVYENFNGAKLNLEGVNVVQYVQHRIDRTSKAPTLESESYWDPFLASPTHEVETEDTIRNILNFAPIELPRKIKFGIALKKPFIFALDWEQWQNELKFETDKAHPATSRTITISNISFLKLGAETSLYILPVTMRGSITGLLRPNTNDPDMAKSFDDLYSTIPVVPVDGNIYFAMGAGRGEFGFGFGGGGLPVIKALTFDISTIAKAFYSNVYYTQDNWQLSYLMTMDPILTGFASDVSTTKGVDSEIRLMATSTLSMGIKF